MTSATDLNPTAASLLGFLDVGPMTGWELDRFVQASIGNFWNVTRSQIYRELRTLTDRGYAKAGTTGPRDRVPYAITAAGRAAFRKWIARPPTPDLIRSRLLLTIFFGHHLPPDRLRDVAQTERERHQAALERYLELEPQLRVSADQRFPLATLRFGIRYERAMIDSLDELLELIDEPQEGPGGA